MPTRLVDVGICEDSKLHLQVTANLFGRYCALSYNWGRSESFKTKKTTYESRLAGFSLDDLPTTIRDAVLLTRLLGFRYLWVDALCIVQDDPAHWAQESAVMDQVYGNATLTIAASSCKDKWESLSPSRKVLEGVHIQSLCSNGIDFGDNVYIGPRWFTRIRP